MKIALFSDIHANLPALEACLADMDRQSPDAIYCLGDLVGYHVWPNEVVEMIRSRRIPVIMGNYDLGVGNNSNDCGCAYKTEEDKERGKVSISYTNSVISDETRQYLITLPHHLHLDFNFDGEPFRMMLVHGSPRRVNEYLFEDREERSLLRMMQQAGAHILCCGHTHRSWHRVMNVETEGKTTRWHAVNIGSVGKPKDGDPRGCYVMLTLNGKNPLHDSSALTVEFIRFSYDIERSATALEGSALPAAFAEALRTGK